MPEKKSENKKTPAKPVGRPSTKTTPIKAADVLKAQGPMSIKQVKTGLFGRKGGPRRSGGK